MVSIFAYVFKFSLRTRDVWLISLYCLFSSFGCLFSLCGSYFRIVLIFNHLSTVQWFTGTSCVAKDDWLLKPMRLTWVNRTPCARAQFQLAQMQLLAHTRKFQVGLKMLWRFYSIMFVTFFQYRRALFCDVTVYSFSLIWACFVIFYSQPMSFLIHFITEELFKKLNDPLNVPFLGVYKKVTL